MLSDLRFVFGALMATAMLAVAAFGIGVSMRLAREAKLGPFETTRRLAYTDRGEWNKFYDAAGLRQPDRTELKVEPAPEAQREAAPAAVRAETAPEGDVSGPELLRASAPDSADALVSENAGVVSAAEPDARMDEALAQPPPPAQVPEPPVGTAAVSEQARVVEQDHDITGTLRGMPAVDFPAVDLPAVHLPAVALPAVTGHTLQNDVRDVGPVAGVVELVEPAAAAGSRTVLAGDPDPAPIRPLRRSHAAQGSSAAPTISVHKTTPAVKLKIAGLGKPVARGRSKLLSKPLAVHRRPLAAGRVSEGKVRVGRIRGSRVRALATRIVPSHASTGYAITLPVIRRLTYRRARASVRR
jgi:hypothetical protein